MRKIFLILFLGVGLSVVCLTPQEARNMALEGFDLLADTAATSCAIKQGLELTRRAAEAGDPVALNNLGYFAASGRFASTPGLEEDSLVSVNYERAAEYYWLALGHRMTSAALNLLELANTHPELGIAPERLATAHMAVARAYALGNSVLPYDFQQAQNHFLQAARLGNSEALRIVRETAGQFPDAFPNLSPSDSIMIFD